MTQLENVPQVEALRTERFTMRSLRRGDEAALFPTLSDPVQCRYLTRPAFTSEGELWSWLADPDWDGRSWIAEDGEGNLVGRFVAIPAHEEGVAEIGYITVIGRQGEGIARECTAALIDHLFGGEDHRKLITEVDIENTPSIALMDRLGFTREAHLREHETTHEGLRDVLLYGLLRRDWGSNR